MCYLHVVSNSNLNNLLVYQLFGTILRLTRFPWIMMMNFGMMISGLKHFSSIEHSYFYIYFEVFVYFITLCALHRETYGVHRFGKQVLNIWNATLLMHFSDIFRQENQRFPVAFESASWIIRSIIQQFSLTVNSTKTIVFLVLRIRCQMGKWFEFVAFQ